jgi:hypothetical protein
MSEPQLYTRIKAIERAKGAYAAIKMKQFAQACTASALQHSRRVATWCCAVSDPGGLHGRREGSRSVA